MKNRWKIFTNLIILSIFYKIPKLVGIIPFTLSVTPVIKASESIKSYMYSVICSVIVTILLPIAQLIMNGDLHFLEARKFASAFVFMIQVICSSLRVIVTFYANVYYRRILISVVNKYCNLYERFSKYSTGNRYRFFESKFRFDLQSRAFSIICQAVVIFLPLIHFSDQIGTSTDDVFPFLISFTFILYTHYVTALVGLSYFIIMTVTAQFYKNLNKCIRITRKNIKLLESDKKVKIQAHCKLSDECDNLCAFLKDITINFTDFNQHSSVFLLINLIQCFIVLLAETFEGYAMLQKHTWNYWFLRKQIAFLIFYGIEMYYIFKVSASLTEEGNKTKAILLSLCEHNLDVRLQKSIELLLFQTQLQAPTIYVCGLFHINNSLLFSIFATFAVYFIILVQFELDE